MAPRGPAVLAALMLPRQLQCVGPLSDRLAVTLLQKGHGLVSGGGAPSTERAAEPVSPLAARAREPGTAPPQRANATAATQVAVAPPVEGAPAGAPQRPPMALGTSTAARRLLSRAHRAAGAAQAGSAGQAGSDAEAKGPFVATWFGDFDQGESTFSSQGISGRYDTVGGYDVDYYNPYSGSSGAESEDFFQETPSAGSRETWQTYYPALGSSVIGNGNQATGAWRSTPEGFVQDYVPSTLVTEKAGGAGKRPAEWFDSNVLQKDGFGRDQLPYPGTPERTMETVPGKGTYVERAVNTTLHCEGMGCSASSALQAYNELREEAQGCTMNVYVYPRGTIASGAKVLNLLKVNGEEVATACSDVPSGCTSQASASSITSLLYPCASQINVGALFKNNNGQLTITGQIGSIRKCPEDNAAVLDGVVSVTCLVRDKSA